MADAVTPNPTLGYSLHQKTTQLIEDFLKNILENDFQYLDEILAEVKEHFGRRESVALLPKTPCMKGKRKRIVRSLDNSFENQPSSSPERGQNKLNNACQTPESKKPAISPLVSQSPDDFVEPKGRVTRSKTKNASENGGDCATGKTKGRGAKKQPKGSKRQTRGKKNASKQVVKDIEVDNKEEKEATPKKKTTRNKRKQEEKETLPTTPVKKSNYDEPQINSPVQCMKKKSKLSVAFPDEIHIPSSAEVFIPETPIIECSSKKASSKKDEDTMSSPQVVLTPKSVAEPVQEISTRAIEEENKVISNPVLIVEATTYDIQENENKNTPEPEEQAISESTVSSTKKTNRRTRSQESRPRYSRGLKRKQDSKDEGNEKDISSSTTNNEAEFKESSTKAQKLEQSDSDNAVVSSTVSSPVQSQRKSTRSSRASTRRSTRLSIKAAQNQRKTKIRKSRSLVKSSVLLKLSTKMMPSLIPQEDNDTVVEAETSNTTSELDKVKTNLFEDQESNDIDQVDIVPEICEAQSTTPCKTANQDPAQENADEDVETEEEEFHDAHENIEEVDGKEYHDATETNEVNDDEKEVTSRPMTRSSSRNESRESQSSEDGDHLSSGSGSQGRSSKEGTLSQDSSDNESESQDNQANKDKVPFYIGPNRVIKNPTGVINSFIKRNTPKKLDTKEKSRLMKRAILEKQEKEKERIEQLELQKQRRIEEQKRKREEKERKAAELRAARAREEQERREQMEKKLDMRKQQEERARKEKEKEEEIKRKVRQQKKAELDARRKQEEEQRQHKLQEKEEEAKRHREMLRRKAEFEEQERQRKIIETKRQQEFREQELEREREQEKLRLVREIEEKERKAKEEKEKAEKKLREEKEKEEKERKRIVQLLREKEESERKEREKKAKEEKWRQERERKLREERERKLREKREAALQEELEKERQRHRKLEEQRLQEEARLRALHNADSYDMTPPPPPRIRSVASSENYNIDDICSDDSTDDEDAPRKRIPSWAQGAKLKAALINQSMGKFDVEAIFGEIPIPNLDEIFTVKKKKRFYQRTSSAHWDSPPLRTLNRGSTLI